MFTRALVTYKTNIQNKTIQKFLGVRVKLTKTCIKCHQMVKFVCQERVKSFWTGGRWSKMFQNTSNILWKATSHNYSISNFSKCHFYTAVFDNTTSIFFTCRNYYKLTLSVYSSGIHQTIIVSLFVCQRISISKRVWHFVVSLCLFYQYLKYSLSKSSVKLCTLSKYGSFCFKLNCCCVLLLSQPPWILYLSLSVCPSVCLSVCQISQTLPYILVYNTTNDFWIKKSHVYLMFVVYVAPPPPPRYIQCFHFYTFFISGTEHPREDNPDLNYWAEITRQHTNI